MSDDESRPFLGIAQPDVGDGEIQEVLDTLHSGWLTCGPKVRLLQERLSQYLQAPHLRCLNSCTAGLSLALLLNDVGPGDEVLVPANTFASCANVIELRGATTVFVDCDPRTGLLDLDHADHLAGPRTRALIAVHLGGHPLDLDALQRLATRRGIAIIEDAAHAIGARWREQPIGSSGNLCSFSFHATKNMTTIEGGALVVRSAEQAARVERLSLHGLSASAWSRHGSDEPAGYDVVEPGFKYAMNDVAAAIGLHQLRRLDGWIDRREALARDYDEQLRELPLTLPAHVPAGARHARHLYTVLVDADSPVDRNNICAALNSRKIGSSVHFHGIHLHRYYRERYALAPEDLPNSTDWSARALTLPLHSAMDETDVAVVCSALAGVLQRIPSSA